MQNPPKTRAETKKDSTRTNMSYSSVASKQQPPTSQHIVKEEFGHRITKELDSPPTDEVSLGVSEGPTNGHSPIEQASLVEGLQTGNSFEAHLQEEAMTSPSSVDDERMKQIEKVPVCISCYCAPHVHVRGG